MRKAFLIVGIGVALAAVAGTRMVFSENAISLMSGGKIPADSEALLSFDSRTQTVVDSNPSDLNSKKPGFTITFR